VREKPLRRTTMLYLIRSINEMEIPSAQQLVRSDKSVKQMVQQFLADNYETVPPTSEDYEPGLDPAMDTINDVEIEETSPGVWLTNTLPFIGAPDGDENGFLEIRLINLEKLHEQIKNLISSYQANSQDLRVLDQFIQGLPTEGL
jgi:hypothetical protein